MDASDVGIGGVLSQRGKNDRLHPCTFLSHRLSPTERNYHVGDRELLAVKLALEEWRHWREGTKHPIQVLTYHKNLEYIQQAKRLNPRQARWSLFSTSLTLSSLFDRGLRTLSLIHYLESTPRCPEKMPHAQLFLQPESLPQCVGLWRPQYVKPKHENQILEMAQRTVCTSLSLLELRFFSGLTRPCLPVILGFSSRFYRAFCQSLGTKVSLSSGFHPESNGQTERINQDLKSSLRCMIGSNPSSWSSYLIWAEYAHNTLRSSSTGCSPFECQFGYTSTLFPEQETEVVVPSVQTHIMHCRRIWRTVQAKLLRFINLIA